MSGDARAVEQLVRRALRPAPSPEARAQLIDGLVAGAGGREELLGLAREELERRVVGGDAAAADGLRLVEGALARAAASAPRRPRRRARPARFYRQRPLTLVE